MAAVQHMAGARLCDNHRRGASTEWVTCYAESETTTFLYFPYIFPFGARFARDLGVLFGALFRGAAPQQKCEKNKATFFHICLCSSEMGPSYGQGPTLYINALNIFLD